MNLRNLMLALQWSLMTPAVSNHLVAQNFTETNFTHYTRQQGLSDNNITGMLQDSTGYIWVATHSGLNRFNGDNFVQFHSTDDSSSLPAEYLRGLVWLDKRRMAAFGEGLHITDTRTGETRNLFITYSNRQYQYKFNGIMAVSGNSAGDMFLLTRSGFYHYDNNYRLKFRFDYYRNEEVATTPFVFGRHLLKLDNQRFAIISSYGIYFYDAAKNLFKKMDSGDCPLFKELLDYPKRDYLFFQHKPGRFIIMHADADSVVYLNIPERKRTVSHLPFHALKEAFGYRSELGAINDTMLYVTAHVSGLYKMRLSPESGKITFFPEKYLPSYYCHQLLEDRDRNLWIATNKGILRDNNSLSYIQQATIPASLQALFPNLVIDDIYEAGDKVYAATRGYAGILLFDKKRLEFIRPISFKKFWRNPNNIYSIVTANDTSLMVGTNGPLFRLNTMTDHITEIALDRWNRANEWIGDLYKDRNGNIWIATENVYRYDAITHRFCTITAAGISISKIERAQSIKEDACGNIWIAGHGLIRYNITSKTFDRLIDSFPFIKIPDRQVNTFTADEQNNLWINSNNNGLVCYNINKGTFRQFTRDDGLPDNNIASMIVIRNKLWIASYSGIACLDLKSLSITSFGNEDGFPDLPIVKSANFFFDSTRNKLFIGFTNTMVQFDPDSILRKSKAPNLFIESLITSDQKKLVLPGENVTTLWRNNEITVNIGSINFLTSNSQRFAYRIVNDDNGYWQQLGTQSTFSISNLSSGINRIQVKLFSASNRWPAQVIEFRITIKPPFWKQTWFICLSVILLSLSVYRLLRWRTDNIRKNEQAKTHLQKLKAEEYKNQFEMEQISNYFSSSMAGKKNVDEVLQDVTKNLIGRMNYEDCIIYMWNEDKTKMIQKAAHGPKEILNAVNTQVFDVAPGQGLVGYVMQTREPLLVADTRKDKRYRVDDMKRLSELCVPIIHDNELIGIIDSEHHKENHFQERDIKTLTTIATLVGNKIKQLESEQLLEVKQKEIAFINQQLAEAQLSALQTQMNPHFIFNSLNSIKGMILDNEQQKASRYLSKFANLIRVTLNQSKEVLTTLYENVEHLESYLLMEKLRFDDSFTFECSVDDDIDTEETLIPTLMLQPLAENAIWHGLLHKEGEKKLTIRFSRLAETISCSIEDNGIGIKRSEQLKQLNKPPYQPVGLGNLRNRIKILNEKYDTGCTLEINDLKDLNNNQTGTRAVLRFNIIINKPFL